MHGQQRASSRWRAASPLGSSIHTDAAQADAKSLIGVLSLAVRPGASIRLVADGPDADTALRALADELTPYVAASVDA